MSYEVVYNPNGVRAVTSFEAVDFEDAAFKFAMVHPDGGMISIREGDLITCFNVQGGRIWYLYQTTDLEVENG